jgi:hypothetical protein
LIPKTAKTAIVRSQLISSGFAPDDENLTFYRCYLGTPDRRLLRDDLIGSATQILAGVVPILAEGELLLRGAHVINEGGYFKRIPVPFLVIINPSETVPQLTERVKIGLGLDEKEWKRIKLMIGEQHATPAKGTLLRGEDIVRDIVVAAQLTGDRYLFVVHPAKTPSAPERAVKIHN